MSVVEGSLISERSKLKEQNRVGFKSLYYCGCRQFYWNGMVVWALETILLCAYKLIIMAKQMHKNHQIASNTHGNMNSIDGDMKVSGGINSLYIVCLRMGDINVDSDFRNQMLVI